MKCIEMTYCYAICVKLCTPAGKKNNFIYRFKKARALND